MTCNLLKASLLSLGVVSAMSNVALAATPAPAVDKFNGQTYCQVHREYMLQAVERMTPTNSTMEKHEAQFNEQYLSRLRSREWARPSVAPLTVPLDGPSSEVVISSPAAGVVAVRGGLAASMKMLDIDPASQRGLRLDLVGSGHVIIDESLAQLNLEELYIFVHGGETSIDMRAVATCGVVDATQASGPLTLDASAARLPMDQDAITLACTTNYYGTNYNDTITADDCNNNLYGYGGNDSLYGMGGNDYVMDGAGSDYVYGNMGADCLHTSEDSAWDYVYGGQGNDTIYAQYRENLDYCSGDLDYDSCSIYCDVKASCEATFNVAFCTAN